MSCRLPRAEDIDAFWRLLRDGVDAVTEVPADRWSPAELPGTGHTRFGAFVDGVADFDAGFFGISPREASAMDPQQRIALELCWHALEDAGLLPAGLGAHAVGVFVGAIGSDYATLTARAGAPAIGAHTLAGLNHGIIANRVSYALGLHGPSLSVDSGQSSSLVAVHLACESLRRGESDLVLAGGVNVVLAAQSSLAAARFGGLSPDGRCHTFDARANGYVRGEGGAVVVLRRLSDALAAGDDIVCVLRGSAVNNDGTTDGLTVPSPRGQQEVLRTAYARARTDPADAQYVELHGTGTALGDPVEAAALGAALGAGRPAADPLLVGSAKTNVGHLEGAAGIVGLVKAALCIRHRQVPPSLNFERPHPRIPLAELGLRVRTELGPWPRPDRPLVAGVSSFGMGGTNCHVVLAEAPSPLAPPEPPEPPAPARRRQGPADGDRPADLVPQVLSARSPRALRVQARRLAALLDGPATDPVDVGYSLTTTRSVFEHRAVVLGRDREELLDGLRSVASGAPEATTGPGARRVEGRAGGGRVAFLFPGQGSQYARAGADLAARYPVFAAALAEVSAHFDEFLERPLRHVLAARGDTPDAALLDRTAYTQPALFALGVALHRLLGTFGVRPDLLAGHSIGELTAAHLAGVLPLADACALVAARGRLMQAVRATGAMAALEATEEEITALLAGQDANLGIAAVNGPRALVVSGDEAAVTDLARRWRERGYRATRLRVSHAFHSPHMDAILDEFGRIARGLSFAPPALPVVSNVTGLIATADELTSPDYWVAHARSAVRFMAGVRHLRRLGAAVFVEVGPGGQLSGMTRASLADPPDGESPVVAPLLRRGQDEQATFLTGLARASVHGVPARWSAAFDGLGARRVRLPGYAFERTRYWLDGVERAGGEPVSLTPLPEPASADGAQDAAPAAAAGIPAADHDAVAADTAAELSRLSRGDRRRVLGDLVRASAAAVLGHAHAGAVDTTRSFRDLGFDSLGGVELGERLAATTGLPLAGTLIYNHPTPDGLIDHLDDLLRAGGAERPSQAGGQSRGAGNSQHGDDDGQIAIVGMACRYPGGVTSPEQLWRLVVDGRDAVGPFPRDRGWDVDALHDPDAAGTTYTDQGGFLDGADQFDPGFFGISAREASAMDPQQRLLLETSWEALERAGIDPSSLRGSATGIYVGVTAQEYGPRLHEPAPGAEGYLLTGTTTSVASGRLAYTLGLEGPAVTIDTACSSSLVAMHLARQALLGGECTLAVAAGATVMASPGMFVEFARQRGLAPDGRCKAFAAAADGTGWAEGVGVVVLARLGEARRQGHPVLAILRGSAINQDGASNGLTAPSGPAQERVIRAALASADLGARTVDAVEAHGTGTSLGDPIEAEALLATYGRDRPSDAPVFLGSLKSNIGHTQAAAGVGGVIKMVLAMRHGLLPRTLHVDAPSPHVNWSRGALALLTEPVSWPAGVGPRRCAVSSFGISGTNAHVVLEAAPVDARLDANSSDANSSGAPRSDVHGSDVHGSDVHGSDVHGSDADNPDGYRSTTHDRGEDGPDGDHPATVLPWALSARGPAALRDAAARLRDWLGARPRLRDADIAHSLAHSRATFEHRAVILGSGRADLLRGLDALAAGEQEPGLVQGVAEATGRSVLVFPGQGAQWPGMGAELLRTSAVFRERIHACADALAPFVDFSLVDLLTAGTGDELERVEVVQPASFALAVALAALWRSVGVEPEAVVGHSQGEIAAAHVAGALSLDDAARVVALRSQIIGSALAGRGGMASVALPADRADGLLEPWSGRLAVAVVNGPHATVVSGELAALAELLAACERDGIRTQRLPVTYASHSPQVEPLRTDLLQALAGIAPHPADVPFYSTVSASRVDTAGLDADYWYRNLRQTVRFAQTVRVLRADGHRVFVEASPHPVLTVPVQDVLDAAAPGEQHTVTGTLRRGDGGQARFLEAAARVHVEGVPVDLTGLVAAAHPVPAGPDAGPGGDAAPTPDHGADPSRPRRVDLPTYPFQRQRFWLTAPERSPRLPLAGLDPARHPLLGAAATLGTGGHLLTGWISLRTHPWLADHAVHGVPVLPGTALLELAWRAADLAGRDELDELTLEAPLALPAQGGVRLQVTLTAPGEDGRREIALYGRADTEADQDSWTRHAHGVLRPADDTRISQHPSAPVPAGDDEDRWGWADPGSWPPPRAAAVDVDALVSRLAHRGYGYGPAFGGLTAAWRAGDDLFADVRLPEPARSEATAFGLHPALLDAALHPAVGSAEATAPIRLPFALSGARLHASGAAQLRVRISPLGEDRIALAVADHVGAPVASVASLVLRPLPAGGLPATRGGGALYRVDWVPAADELQRVPSGRWAALVGPGGHQAGRTGLAAACPGGQLDEVADLATLRAALDADPHTEAPQVVLALLSDPGSAGTGDDGVGRCTADALALLQGWLAEPRLAGSRLVLLTRGAVAAVPGDDLADLARAGVWGLVRTAQSENPDCFVLVDLAPAGYDGLARALTLNEPQVALRDGAVLVPRLAPVEITAPARPATDRNTTPPDTPRDLSALGWDRNGTILITGGTGTLARILAHHLVHTHGHRHLHLPSRSATCGSFSVNARARP
ncbi:type I polyketide synthase, partial [Frankia canadensis]|uniref:type I polyketide synthase n=1 Tax=Frankia canadensis TaxID=1836972 RepID=UPI003C2DECD7